MKLKRKINWFLLLGTFTFSHVQTPGEKVTLSNTAQQGEQKGAAGRGGEGAAAGVQLHTHWSMHIFLPISATRRIGVVTTGLAKSDKYLPYSGSSNASSLLSNTQPHDLFMKVRKLPAVQRCRLVCGEPRKALLLQRVGPAMPAWQRLVLVQGPAGDVLQAVSRFASQRGFHVAVCFGIVAASGWLQEVASHLNLSINLKCYVLSSELFWRQLFSLGIYSVIEDYQNAFTYIAYASFTDALLLQFKLVIEEVALWAEMKWNIRRKTLCKNAKTAQVKFWVFCSSFLQMWSWVRGKYCLVLDFLK